LKSGGSERVYSWRISRVGGAPFWSGGSASVSALSRETSTASNDMGTPLCLCLAKLDCGTIQKHLPGAQTERRGDAVPVKGLLGGKDPTGRFLIRAGRTCFPSYCFTFSSSSFAASARKRRSSRLVAWFSSIQLTARSYDSRALSFSPSRQWAIARKYQLKLS